MISIISKSNRPGTDQVSEDHVQEAVAANPTTNAYKIDVRVKDGKVILTGTVAPLQELLLAGKVARGVTGVRALETISTQPTRSSAPRRRSPGMSGRRSAGTPSSMRSCWKSGSRTGWSS